MDIKAWKHALRESAVMVILAAILGISLNLALPGGYVFVGKEINSYRKIAAISAGEARVKYDGRVALFVDARDRGEFEQERIPGAISIPAQPDSISLQRIKEHFARLQEPRELVIYCGGGSCETSEILARRFIHMGYAKILYILEGGLPAWQEKNYPVETGRERRGD